MPDTPTDPAPAPHPVAELGPAPRLADGRFANPAGSPTVERRRSIWGFMWRQMTAPRATRLPVAPAGHSLGTDEALAGLADLARRETVTWLGHAAFLLRMGGRTVLIDPYLAPWASPVPGIGPRRFVDSPIPVERLPPIDVVAVSHNHYDHLDAPTLRRLARRVRVAVVPLGLGPTLRRLGFAEVRELDWGAGARFGDLTITAVPAVHFSRRGFRDRNRTLWCGFALESAGRRVFFGGDTAKGEVFRAIGDAFGGFDLALLGIGAYEPREIMLATHATPEEAVQIGRDLGARHVMGMHWGTVVLTTEPVFEPPERFRAAARAAGYADDSIWLMRIGETRDLPYGAAGPRNAAG